MEDSDRAARLIDMMARDGLLGPAQGSKPREVLVKPDYFQEIADSRMGVEEDE
jgi:S-DNA-T family DNA segregation ATPase FtsK/SpoIIIE